MVPFEYWYSQLPERFYEARGPTAFENSNIFQWNEKLAVELGIDSEKYSKAELALIFSGRKLQLGAKPLAQAYSGHQFGHLSPILGDGRALLLGELRDRTGNLRDIHLKGSGPTQFSRRGDGYANLSAGIREYIVSEALFHLGVPSCRSLALIETGQPVFRRTQEPGVILVRVASSHVRVGTFEYFWIRKDFEGLRILSDFVIDRHFPHISKNTSGYLEMFREIVLRQARLVAHWTQIGFVHGVLNTDNTFVSGETLDLGPCAFMEEYNPEQVFSSIDTHGRYAFDQQPKAIQWNLAQLGSAILSFVQGDKESLKKDIVKIIEEFEPEFESCHLKGMGKKFGIQNANESDLPLMQEFLEILFFEKKDYTNSFRNLSGELVGSTLENCDIQIKSVEYEKWLEEWKSRLKFESAALTETRDQMNRVNPKYIPRNHRIQEAIDFALQTGNLEKFETLLEVVIRPFDEQPENEIYARAAGETEKVTETFCNT